MKNLILLAIGATLLSTSAFATKARLEALGEDQFGSQYVDDNRNMFLNAAEIHNHHDFLVFDAGDTNNLTDNAATPKASGGYFTKRDGAVMGVYLGQDSNTAAQLRGGALSALQTAGAISVGELQTYAAEVNNDNTLDLFYGRDGSMKWGVRFSYSASSNEQGGTGYGESSQEGILLGLGALKGDWSYYANLGLSNKAEIQELDDSTSNLTDGKDMEIEGSIGVQVGAIKDLGQGARAFIEYRSIGIEQDGLGTIGSSNFDNKWEVQRINVGWAKAHKVNDSFTAFYRAEYFQETNENFAYVEDYEFNTSYTKFTLGFESVATSWLVVRGSISNFLTSEEDEDGGSSDGKRTLEGVNLAMGATLKFGDFAIDGLIANDTDGDGTLNEGGTTAEDDKDGILRTDSLMSRVSLVYNF